MKSIELKSGIKAISSIIILLELIIFNEWLFVLTKPSYLNELNINEAVFLLASAILVVFFILQIILLFLSPLILIKLKDRSLFIYTVVIFISFIASLFTLIIVDNFSYTIFGFGMASIRSDGIRGMYLVFFIILICLFLYRWLKYYIYKKSNILLMIGLIIACVSIVLVLFKSNNLEYDSHGIHSLNIDEPYNILIISSDGVNASNMSVYGYEKNTTPFLKNKSSEFQIFENSFTNNANTAGSIISLLTGVGPATSKVVFPPDVLTGKYVFNHVPGILNKSGYFTHDESTRHYARARDFNLQGAFHQSNENTLINILFKKINDYFHLSEYTKFFLDQTYNRISVVLKFLFFISYQENPYAEVNQIRKSFALHDRIRIQKVQKVIQKHSPFFIHVHFLGTHGPNFKIDNPLFSAGLIQTEKYQLPFYNDSIRQFDEYIKKLYLTLVKTGKLEKTILIITSDHGKQLTYSQRIPLLIRYPGMKYTGIERINTQRIDIAPTILDFLETDIPLWYEGKSLLRLNEIGNEREIYAAKVGKVKMGNGKIFVAKKNKLGFGSLGSMALIICDQIYEFNINNADFRISEIPDYSSLCKKNVLLTKKQAVDNILKYLEVRGYPVDEIESIN